MGEAGPTDEYIYQRDMDWLNEADLVIAEVSTPSLGVGYEIGRMDSQKPILCLYREQPEKKLSAMIMGNKNLSIKKYQDLPEVQKIIEEFLTQNKNGTGKNLL